ncbi:MAG: hypothetical protein A49_10950 [Methyloceanibacter sp.]|nr:MAG: hypothetical protein A49_10950 [Methyloceanibacter sp.]
MLNGAAVMGTLVSDGGDDAHLVVGPADATDSRLVAQAGLLAVGGHEKCGAQVPAARETDIGAKGIRSECLDTIRCDQLDRGRGGDGFPDGFEERAGLHQPGMSLSIGDVLGEAKKMRAERRVQRTVRDFDGRHRLSAGLQARPQPNRGK